MIKAIKRKNYNEEARIYIIKSIIKEKINIFFSKYSSLILRYFVPGRVIWVCSKRNQFGWGILVGTKLRYTPNKFFVDVLTQCTIQKDGQSIPKPGTIFHKVVRFSLNCIKRLSPFIINLPISLISKKNTRNIWQKILLLKNEIKYFLEKEKSCPNRFFNKFQLLDGLPVLNPINHIINKNYMGFNYINQQLDYLHNTEKNKIKNLFNS
jgi:hypothetical protein